MTQRRVLSASEAAQRLHAKRQAAGDLSTSERVAELNVYVGQQRRQRDLPARVCVSPTPERIAKGNLESHSIYAPNGFVAVRVQTPTFGVAPVSKSLGKSWSPTLIGALTRFVSDAHAADVRGVTLNYDRAGGSHAWRGQAGGLGEDEHRRIKSERYDFVMRRIHLFRVPGEVDLLEILSVALGFVENHIQGNGNPSCSWSDLGLKIEPSYRDAASARAHLRGALHVLAQFILGCHIQFEATCGAQNRQRISGAAI